MDASPLFDPKYLPVIVVTLVGFAALAALLLVPISRFLDREQEVAEEWTPEAVAERLREREHATTNGAQPAEDEEESAGAANAGPSSST